MKAVLLIAALGLVMSAAWAAEPSGPSLIPRPVKFMAKGGTFALKADTAIHYSGGEAAKTEAETLAAMLRPATGLPLPVSEAKESNNAIALRLEPRSQHGAEGYELFCGNGIEITAAAPAGLFYAGQTLRQLLPPAIYAKTAQAGVKWEVPCCSIIDQPRFAWRGYMLDFSRHFFTVEYAKHLLDGLAMHKINLFQMHLTDDDGWRVEIKKYPKLTEIGAWRGTECPLPNTRPGETHKRYGGFFTQDQIREIVAYAARLHINVMPEIDMPGHCLAIMTAYPETRPDRQGPPPLDKKGQPARDNAISPARPENYKIVNDIMAEVAELFPFEYIHVGGDEVNFKLWENCPSIKALIEKENLGDLQGAQVYFTKQLEQILADHKKKMIGWNEILNDKLARTTAIMSWTGVEPGYKAVRMGFPVVMSPGSYSYFDMAYSKLADEPPGHTWAGIIDTSRAYALDPQGEKGLDAEQQKKILGVQANLWAEFLTEWKSPTGWLEFPTNGEHADYKTFPRACALAEVGWTPQDLRNWEDFANRLGPEHLVRLANCGINFRVPPPELSAGPLGVRIQPPYKGAEIRYTVDGSDPRESAAAKQWDGKPVRADGAKFRARTVIQGRISPMAVVPPPEPAAKKKGKKK